LNILVDTVALIRFTNQRRAVPEPAREALTDGANQLFISVASAWEYGHKRLIKPHELPISFAELVAELPLTSLSLDYEIASYAESLPLIHRDPFDRMLVAQALHHQLTIVTSDSMVRRYPVPTIWD
jgi:PIN domain nuclease of toxin-antitoxin system